MLNCIPPTRESLERIERSSYAVTPGISWKTLNNEDSFYTCRLGDSVATKVTQFRNPTVAVTSNSEFDNSTNRLYYLDETGRVTEDATQAKSVAWAEAKNGHQVMFYQQPYDASQAYQKKDIVEKDGWVYQSSIDDNVWAPDAIEARTAELWTEITCLKINQAIHSQLISCVNKGYLPPIHRYDWWEIE